MQANIAVFKVLCELSLGFGNLSRVSQRAFPILFGQLRVRQSFLGKVGYTLS